METKDQLINHVKRWINTDEEIRVLQKQIKDRKLQQKELSTQLMEVMKNNDIDCKIHYPIPLSSQRPYALYNKSNCKVADFQARHLITLPIHQYLTKTHLDYMFNKIKNFIEHII